MAHGGEGPVVQVDDVQLPLHAPLLEGAEDAEARGIHQHGHLRLLGFQQIFDGVKALLLQQIQRQHPHLGADLFLQLF